MTRKNKGYSLIELVVTLAVFSIIMIAIIMLMRTAMISYREGLFETQMQEEAQIVANQVSEFLIDASEFDKQSGDSYSFKGAEGPFTLKYSSADHSLYYYSSTLDGISGSNMSLISDAIYDDVEYNEEGEVTSVTKGFEIKGLSKRTNEEDKSFKDNKVTVVVNVKSNDKTYSAVKDVYFRNNIEDVFTTDSASDSYLTFGAENADVENKVSTGGVNEVAVLRYDEVDLSREFGIVYGIKDSDYLGKGFIMINPDAADKKIGNGVNNEISASFKAAHSDKKYEHYVIKVDPTLESAYSQSRPKTLITGYDAYDNKVEVYVYLDAVDIKEGSKVLRTYVYQETASDGYPNDIMVKGINIQKALEADVEVTFDAELKKGSTSLGKYTDEAVKPCPAAGSPSSSSPTNIYDGWGFEIFANISNSNLVLVIPNGRGKGIGKNDSTLFDNLDSADTYDKNNLTMSFYIDGTKVDTLQYEVYPAGKYVTNAGK